MSNVRFRSVRFHNYKALRDFSITFAHMNVLVGPNNSGKSTVIGAFRVLAAGLLKARAQRAEWIQTETGGRHGYRIPDSAIPISLENIATDYQPLDVSVVFSLSNSNRLVLEFPQEGGAILFADASGRAASNPSAFRREFPITLTIVPVLGPVEHDEPLILEETVRKNLATHRASRNFRNYWHYNRDSFQDFRHAVSTTWPGMDIQEPRQLDPLDAKITMFCIEDGVLRELYWSGFGFQVWCQILTHVSRAKSSTLIVIDEPEIYLHPDLQRQLIGILRDAGPDVLVATHSTEIIIAECEANEILIVNKHAQSAKRVASTAGVPPALRAIGSSQSAALTQIARTKRVLFVEGGDASILRRFARRIGFNKVATGRDFAIVSVGGFATPVQLAGIARGISEAIEGTVLFAGLFDRDYRSDEEVDSLEASGQFSGLYRILRRKEVENYLLVPSVLDRAIGKAIAERQIRTGEEGDGSSVSVENALRNITEGMKSHVLGQLAGRRAEFLRPTGINIATVTAQVSNQLEADWNNLDFRLKILPGKEVLAALSDWIRETYKVSLSHMAVVDEFLSSEVAQDLVSALREVERLISTKP